MVLEAAALAQWFWSRALMPLVAIVVAGSIGLSIYLARREALKVEFERIDAYARDVLDRSNSTADQVAAGIALLLGSGAAPCSESELAVMRKIDLGSTYIQTIGRVEGTGLVCSSLGRHDPPLDLGPRELVTPKGGVVRTSVAFPFAGDARFLVLERDGFAAIVHKALPIDATTREEDASLGVFLVSHARLLSTRGEVDPAWMHRPRRGRVARFIDGGRIVTVVASENYNTAAIAAIPLVLLDDRVRRFSLLLVPIGLAAGLSLAALLAYVSRKQNSLRTALKAGIRKGELFVQYQPIVDLRTGQWVGAEALVRWKRATGELVRPDLFIPVAEDSGLIHAITQRVLARVTADLGTLAARGLRAHVSVNLSSADLHSTATVALIERVLAESRCPPECLHVEATERGFIQADVAAQVVAQIRALGVKVAIDDFGTGYSSLSYLESFGLDYLKIDKSFIEAVGSEAATSQVVPHIIEMAKSLGLTMIAEGVETESQAIFLRERGVQLAQGWLFSKPLPFDAFLDGLAAWSPPREDAFNPQADA